MAAIKRLLIFFTRAANMNFCTVDKTKDRFVAQRAAYCRYVLLDSFRRHYLLVEVNSYPPLLPYILQNTIPNTRQPQSAVSKEHDHMAEGQKMSTAPEKDEQRFFRRACGGVWPAKTLVNIKLYRRVNRLSKLSNLIFRKASKELKIVVAKSSFL